MHAQVRDHQAVQREKHRRPFAYRAGLAVLAYCLVFSPPALYAQNAFDSGSDGSDGALNVTTGTETLDPPADGIFNFTTITVAQGATLTFNRNPLNTPIFLLATGDIEIAGTINVSGFNGTSSPPVGGPGGPGGSDGGAPGIAGGLPGDGLGPGGGSGGTDNFFSSLAGGGGAYSTRGNTPGRGNTYGSPLLVPLVGGSGGGGVPNFGGGGGGGAILLASSTRVNISSTGRIVARGGNGSVVGHGSGGAIRIVAPVVSGTGSVEVNGGFFNSFSTGFVTAGAGRIRVDLIDRSQLGLNFSPASALSAGAFMQVFPPVVPRLDIVNVAGQAIPEGTAGPVQVLLPFGSPTAQEVTIQARDFSGVVPIAVVLTPVSGPRTVVEAEIDMSTGNPTQVVVPVEIPVNVVTQVNVWTR